MKIKINESDNLGQGVLKPLVILFDNGADISFQEIETLQKNYREYGEIEISGKLESIMKSSKEFDEKGIVYELI
jgi:hypothetical protein